MTSRLLHLMRHGDLGLTDRLTGWSDLPVTAAGIAACADQAEGLEVAAVISSDLARAADCARPIADRLGLPLVSERGWRELNFGRWDGLATSDIDPVALGAFWDDPEAAPPPGGECWSDLVARVQTAIRALPRQPALVVAHGGSIRAALHVLCGFEQPQLWSFDLPYGALMTLRVWDGDPPSGQILGLFP